MKVTVLPIVIGALGIILSKGTGRFRNQTTSGDHPD